MSSRPAKAIYPPAGNLLRGSPQAAFIFMKDVHLESGWRSIIL